MVAKFVHKFNKINPLMMSPSRVRHHNIILLATNLEFLGNYKTIRFSLQNKPQFTIENNLLKGPEIFYRNDITNFGKSILECLENNLDFVGLVCQYFTLITCSLSLQLLDNSMAPKPFQIDAVTDEEFTYRMMRDRSVRCALWLRSQGLMPRDVIAICSDNRVDYMTPCLAALYLGAIFSPWNVKSKTGTYPRTPLLRPSRDRTYSVFRREEGSVIPVSKIAAVLCTDHVQTLLARNTA